MRRPWRIGGSARPCALPRIWGRSLSRSLLVCLRKDLALVSHCVPGLEPGTFSPALRKQGDRFIVGYPFHETTYLSPYFCCHSFQGLAPLTSNSILQRKSSCKTHNPRFSRTLLSQNLLSVTPKPEARSSTSLHNQNSQLCLTTPRGKTVHIKCAVSQPLFAPKRTLNYLQS
jgi:hypothetical protein